MPVTPLSDDEHARVRALAALDLDAGRATEFEALAALASRIFDTPIAAISIVGRDRQWFKASIGLDAPGFPRDQALCAHTILHPDTTFCVPDAANDARFADNPLVTGPFGLRFYAAAPIEGPSGHVLGTVFVIDRVPRQCHAGQLEQLREVALGAGCALKRHAVQREVRQRASGDPLTGLLNRTAFMDRLAAALASQDRAGLLSIDLDGFKAINDMFGHAGGDVALREVADRLSRLVGPGEMVCRYGGDEFWFLASDIEGAPDLYQLCARLHAEIAAPLTIDRQAVTLRASIGVTVFPDDAESSDALIRKMDAALWEAKRSGRGCTRFAASARRPMRAGPKEVRRMLQKALFPPGQEPFAFALQPMFSAATKTLRGFEALVRWPNGKGGALHPADFIPQAESTGLIVELDRWMLDQACQIAATWPAPFKIASNLSATNFFAGNLVQEVSAILDRHGLPPERLEVEITETVLLGNHDHVRSTLRALREMGVGVVLDDFGAGYASIAYLRSYEFDAVKIDRSFIHGIETDARSRAFLRAIVDLAGALGLETVAEGVETEGQLALLRQHGVTAIQGYLLGRPMCPQAAQTLIEAAGSPIGAVLDGTRGHAPAVPA